MTEENKGVDYILHQTVGVSSLAQLDNLQKHQIVTDLGTGRYTPQEYVQRRKDARTQREHKWKKAATRAFRKKFLDVESKLSYDALKPVYALWDEYAGRVAESESHVAKMDLHGAAVRIVKAADPSLAGFTGRVVKESFNTITVIDESGVIRVIGKEQTLIDLETPNGLFEVNLSGMRCRPYLRPTKKWKQPTPVDLPF